MYTRSLQNNGGADCAPVFGNRQIVVFVGVTAGIEAYECEPCLSVAEKSGDLIAGAYRTAWLSGYSAKPLRAIKRRVLSFPAVTDLLVDNQHHLI